MLRSIYDRVTELNSKKCLLKAKYEQDEKYARIHKRLVEKKSICKRNAIARSPDEVKTQTDEQLQNNKESLENEAYFTDSILIW